MALIWPRGAIRRDGVICPIPVFQGPLAASKGYLWGEHNHFGMLGTHDTFPYSFFNFPGLAKYEREH